MIKNTFFIIYTILYKKNIKFLLPYSPPSYTALFLVPHFHHHQNCGKEEDEIGCWRVDGSCKCKRTLPCKFQAPHQQ